MFTFVLKRGLPLAVVLGVLQPLSGQAAPAQQAAAIVTAQPPSADPDVAAAFIDPATDPQLPEATMTALIRARIDHVFVIFNENESFDHEYGTFPGANGLYSTGRAPRAAAATPGFDQTYLDRETGAAHVVRPFRLGPAENANVSDSVDHTHRGLAAKLRVIDGVPTMSGFAQVEFDGKAASAGGTIKSAASAARGRQFADLVMSYIDCDTIPFFWRYASRFTLFDAIFATEDTPSTPNAIAVIAGQSGETQWVKHAAVGEPQGFAGGTRRPPFVTDAMPYWGSALDATAANRTPIGRDVREMHGVAANATFASIPLTAAGASVAAALAGDRHAATNEADIRRDIPAIAAHGTPSVAWRWYQDGYDHEPTDPPGVTTHFNFVTHHEGPQYFGYIADNTGELPNLRGEGDVFADIAADRVPPGIIYVRGGYGNIQGLTPPIQNPAFPRILTAADIATIETVKAGDDDHPAYADRQISEAMTARIINAVAAKPALWTRSAIIITYDESDGFYDHVPPRILSYGPDGLPLSRGVRVPLLVISPYARAHVVSHAEGDHNAVIETINQIFDLPALSSLPDEAEALLAGNAPAFNRFGPPGFEQRYLGPRDTNSPITDSLISAFEPARLRGLAAPLPAAYAAIPDDIVGHLPHYGGRGCAAIGVIPEDHRQGIATVVPRGFNPLAATLPQYNMPTP